MDDKVWNEFVTWWKSRYITTPHRPSVELFQEWQKDKPQQSELVKKAEK